MTGAGCGNRDGKSGERDAASPSAAPDKSAEMQWALEVAESFLGDVAAGKWDSAKMKVVTSRREPGPGSLVGSTICDEMGGDYKPGEEFKTWMIESKLLSPAKDEASFRGTMSGPRGVANFSLLVRTDEADKKWRVGDFTVKITPK